MKFIFVGFDHSGPRWKHLVKGDNVDYISLSDVESAQAAEKICAEPAILILSDFMATERRKEVYRELTEKGAHLIPIGSETILLNFATVDGGIIEQANRYAYFGGSENYLGLVKWLEWKFNGGEPPPPPLELPPDGIFEPGTRNVYSTLSEYSDEMKIRGTPLTGRIAGLLCHRTLWENEELDIEIALIDAFARRGIKIIPVFTDGGSREGSREISRLIADCMCYDKRPAIQVFINRLIFMGHGKDGKNLFEMAVEMFRNLGVPVLNPIASYFITEQKWRDEPNPIASELAWSYMTPEIQGMIEPIIIAARDDEKHPVPLLERIDRFAGRASRWMALSEKPNSEKQLALILHNAPCSGVEATVGMGYELDVFESAALLLARLKNEGWHINPVPKDGTELKRWMMNKKAYQDFRWTSVEDIIESRGVLYEMPVSEYMNYYESLPPENRKKIESLYGPPPGEGMVSGDKLVISGIFLGSVRVFVQPKRGCYGSKCTGEVCKILQDPHCPPPHQFLATYWYIQNVFKADAYLHFGTHGAVDFLPGKSTGLSAACWPDIVLGELPNLYVYNSNVPSEAVVAKRRAYAAIIDHLPSVSRGISEENRTLLRLADEFIEAYSIGTPHAESLLAEMDKKVSAIPELAEMLADEEDALRKASLIRQLLLSVAVNPSAGTLRVLGAKPTENDAVSYIRELWERDRSIEDVLLSFGGDELSRHEPLSDFIRKALKGEADILRYGGLAVDTELISYGLEACTNEMDSLINALSGRYIEPGIYGGPDDNGRDVIPTGRNLFTMDANKVPSKAAYATGMILSEQLVAKYIEDEGRYPEQVSMNMISQDITRSKGEQVSQIMHLMGIRPVWDVNGKVQGLEAIGLEELRRPRIDVTVRITGVLRDSWPDVVARMDDAVILASSIEEPPEWNYVRKHTLMLTEELKKAEVADPRRRAAIRIFGDPPGAFGADIDLALKASAWKDESDLVRFFIEASSHAYGRGLSGQRAVREFVFGAKRTDVSYDITSSRRYDVLSSGFSAEIQGGFGLLAKTLGGKKIRQYQGSTEKPGRVTVMSLSDKLQECLEETMFNPIWKRSAIEKGYEGGGDIMNRLQNVFSWQILTETIGDEAVDRLVSDYVLNDAMREFLLNENRFAMEEIARRFMELHERGKWNGDEDCLLKLREIYLDIEGAMEDGVSGSSDTIQGGSIEIISDDNVEIWNRRLSEVDTLLAKERQE